MSIEQSKTDLIELFDLAIPFELTPELKTKIENVIDGIAEDIKEELRKEFPKNNGIHTYRIIKN